MDITLVMFKSDGTRRDFPLTKPRVVIGRQHACDLRIPLNSVSRQHCELTIRGEALHLKDLGSSNGTYHNSNRVVDAVLKAGDELVIGPVVFTVVIDGKPGRIEPVRTILNNDAAGTGVIKSPQRSSTPQAGEAEPVVHPAGRGDKPHQDHPDDEDDPLAALEALEDEVNDSGSEGSSLGEFEFLMDEEEKQK